MNNPVIESFRLYGLHGYKDVEIEFSEYHKIVMAENGSGKTTVLSAMAAFLKGEYSSLYKLPFEKLECKFQNSSDILRLERSLLNETSQNERLRDLEQMVDVPINTLRELVNSSKTNEEVGEQLWKYTPHLRSDISETVGHVREKMLLDLPGEVRDVKEKTRSVMGSTKVLHLPTYRRIEAPLKSQNRKRATPYRSKRTGSQAALFPNSGVGVQYGLSDVEERLAELVGQIQSLSNQGYRQISATIIDDLLAGGIYSVQRQDLPSIESLRLFFSRVDQNSGSTSRTDRLAELYELGDIDIGSNLTLKYFLSKLAVVIGETEELESNIEKFVEQVNIYLGMSSDEKVLLYNSTEMKVQVINTWTESEVEMNDLSSGEKQVVSLFSYLYLHSGKNIVLMDEPELSLSIEWQRRLLMDVINSPTCLQLLAITHSPFIFDNELDPIAGPMNVLRNSNEY